MTIVGFKLSVKILQTVLLISEGVQANAVLSVFVLNEDTESVVAEHKSRMGHK